MGRGCYFCGHGNTTCFQSNGAAPVSRAGRRVISPCSIKAHRAPSPGRKASEIRPLRRRSWRTGGDCFLSSPPVSRGCGRHRVSALCHQWLRLPPGHLRQRLFGDRSGLLLRHLRTARLPRHAAKCACGVTGLAAALAPRGPALPHEAQLLPAQTRRCQVLDWVRGGQATCQKMSPAPISLLNRSMFSHELLQRRIRDALQLAEICVFLEIGRSPRQTGGRPAAAFAMLVFLTTLGMPSIQHPKA